MRMVWRVCKRAGIRRLSSHQLRHPFANRFARASDRDIGALRGLMGHSRTDTTQQYLDEVGLDELAEALDRAAAKRHAQASPDLTTLESEVSTSLERLEWRRRESNPRPRQGGFGRKPSRRGSPALGYFKRVAPEAPARRLFAKGVVLPGCRARPSQP